MSPKDRRPLSEGLKPEPELDPKTARDFVYQNTPMQQAATPEPKPSATTRLAVGTPNSTAEADTALVPLTARIQAKKFKALKRASFERQLQGVEPSSIQDIVDEAITPWLRKHGYLP